jgi:hypothetical protein
MNFQKGLLIVATVLLIMIILSLGTSCYNYMPHYRTTMQLYPYEPFTQNQYPTTGGNVSGNSLSVTSLKVEGFEGLQSSPFTKEIPIDTISHAVGNNQCQSVGYYNSKGNLCLDDAQILLLRTRGGNASGGESQIGY